MPWKINKGLCKNAYHTIIWIFKIDIWMNPASPDRLQEDKDSNSTVDYNWRCSCVWKIQLEEMTSNLFITKSQRTISVASTVKDKSCQRKMLDMEDGKVDISDL